MKIEHLILSWLVQNIEFTRKIIAFLDDVYFSDYSDKHIFNVFKDFFTKYNALPTKAILTLEVEKQSHSEEQIKEIKNIIETVYSYTLSENIDWIYSKTEEFCKNKAIYNAILQSIKIIDDKNSDKNKLAKTAIPDLLSKALSISFDTNVGHDYLAQLKTRYDFYHNNEEKIPFDIDLLNKITNNGIPKKTLSVVSAVTGGGKSIFLCHHAANCLRQNKNVLYITLEMSEQRIAERIDANLLDIKLDDLRELPYLMYEKKFIRATQNIKGRLIIKEYPTGSATVLNFQHLLNELKLKQNFEPDVIIVDYLNICSSARYKTNNSVNSYTLIKSIAEELRGLAVEKNVQVFSATQLNRCLGLETIVITENGQTEIKNVKIGDKILGNDGWNEILEIYDNPNEVYEITLENGQTIICSKDHLFPSNGKNVSIESGLSVGDYLETRSEEIIMKSKIISIKKLDVRPTRDIVLTGNKLFWANGILTHNSGYGNSEVDLSHTSESMGLPATCDFFFTMISTEDLDKLNQIIFKQLKNRFSDTSIHRKFIVGLDKSKMKFYDVNNNAQMIIDTDTEKHDDDDDGESKSKFNNTDEWR